MRHCPIVLMLPFAIACAATPAPPATVATAIKADAGSAAECGNTREPEPATELMAKFHRAVQSLPTSEDVAQRDMLTAIYPLVQKHLMAYKDELHHHAHWELAQLEIEQLPSTDGWTRMPSTFKELSSVYAAFNEGRAPQVDWVREKLFLMSYSAIGAIKAIRQQIQAMSLPMSVYSQQAARNSFAPPRVIRLNEDLEAPALALISANEVFMAHFVYDPQQGWYRLTKSEWYLQQPPPNSKRDLPAAGTMDEAEELPPTPADSTTEPVGRPVPEAPDRG